MKKEYAIITGCLFTGIIIYLFICFQSAKNATNEANQFNAEIVQQMKKDFANQTKAEQNKTLMYNKQIDSLKTLFNYSEDLRKKNFKYYENEALKLKAVNTFVKRNIYLDSLNAFINKQ